MSTLDNPKAIFQSSCSTNSEPYALQNIGDMIIELNQKRGYTFCLIEHDMQLIERLCHRIIVLAEGRILQEGSMEEIRNNAKVVDAYFGSANI